MIIKLTHQNYTKCKLNKIIKENINDKKLKMIPILIHKFLDILYMKLLLNNF